MLILPPGHAQATIARRRLSAREKWILGGVLSVTLGLVVAVLISLAISDPKSGTGCINVTAQDFIGGHVVSGCGAHAREICRSAAIGSGYSRAQDQAIVAACRRQSIPFG